MNPIIRLMEWIDQTLFATAGKISPWLMPIPSGLILGWTFGVNMQDVWGEGVASFAGWCATAGVVGLGAYASHNAVKRGGEWWWLVAGHALLVIASLLVLNAALHIKGVGIILELMTALSYVASAGARKSDEEAKRTAAAEVEAELAQERDRLAKEKQEEAERLATEKREAAELAHQQQLEVERLRLEHEQKMAKIEADKAAKIAKASVQPGVKVDSPADTPKLSEDDQRQTILDALNSAEPPAKADLARQLGISRTTLYSRIEQLKADGLLHSSEHPPAPQPALNGKHRSE